MRPVLAALLLIAFPALAGEAFVTNQGSNTVSIVDLEQAKVVATVPVTGRPAGVTVASDGLVYVTRPEDKMVSVLDPHSRKMVDETPLGSGPLGIASNPVTGDVYVADWNEDVIFVLRDRDLVATIAVGDSPSGLAVTPDGQRLLSADRDSHQVSVIDLGSSEVVGTVPVGIRPFGVTIDAAGRLAYTANVGSNDVSVIDLATLKVIASVKVGERPYAVALTKGRAFVTNSYGDSVSVFDTATRAPVGLLDTGEYPEGIMASEDGSRIYVANWFSNTLSIVDSDSLDVLADVEVGDGPRAFGNFLLE